MRGQVAATLSNTGTNMNRTHHSGILAIGAHCRGLELYLSNSVRPMLELGRLHLSLGFLVRCEKIRVLRRTGPARRVVLAGFVVGVICSLIGTQIIGE